MLPHVWPPQKTWVTGDALRESEIINSWNPTSLFAVRFLKLFNEFLRSPLAFAFAFNQLIDFFGDWRSLFSSPRKML